MAKKSITEMVHAIKKHLNVDCHDKDEHVITYVPKADVIIMLGDEIVEGLAIADCNCACVCCDEKSLIITADNEYESYELTPSDVFKMYKLVKVKS